MARDFATKLYNSKEWKATREYIYNKYYGLCDKCGRPGEEVHHKKFLTPKNIEDPNITLGEDNLILLCRECHRAEHDNAAMFYRMNKVKSYKAGEGLTTFDDRGMLVKNHNVYIVHGAPSSGKSTYVKENKGRYDIVVDMDSIRSAISYRGVHDNIYDTLPIGQAIIDYLYEIISKREYYFDKCWVIVTMPKSYDRMELARKLQGRLIHIDTDCDTCIEYARGDETRHNSSTTANIIKWYFEEFEE